MSQKLIVAATLGLTLTSSVAFAAEPVEKSPFKSSAELGALFKSGNTESLDLTYEKDLWRSTLDLDLLVKKADQVQDDATTDFETVDQRWLIVSKTNYTLDKESKSYAYGDVAYEDNRSSSFDNQSSISAGWGREWFKDEKSSFTADIGPGYRRDVIKATSEVETAFIIQAQALYLRQINENVAFKQTFSAKYSPKTDANSQYNTESSITAALMDTLKLKFSFRIDHNTEVQPGTKSTDTETAITLVYSF